MIETPTREQWDEIGRKLREPFDPEDVDFFAKEKGKRTKALAYIDARAVQDRLDEVVGPGAWSFDWEPVYVDKGEVQLAKGVITIYGVPKADIGDASSFSASKGAVSDVFKRCGYQWGIGRYLYDVEKMWVQTDQYGQISDQDRQRMRSALPRPGNTGNHANTAANASQRAPQGQQGAAPVAQAQPHPQALQRPPAAPERVSGVHAAVASSGSGVYGEEKPPIQSQVDVIARLAAQAGVQAQEVRTFAEAAQEIQRLRQLDPMVAAVMRGTQPN